MPTNLVILGCTGSIGRQTLQVVEALPDRFQVVGLAAGRNLDLFAEQVRRFRPRLVAADVDSKSLAASLDLRALGAECVAPEEIAKCAEADLVVVATTGKAGLSPSLHALRAGKTLCLANKEVLTMAGALVQAECLRHGGLIRPVDSEHSALWQCLVGEHGRPGAPVGQNVVGLGGAVAAVQRLVLTASGGAFRDLDEEHLAQATARQALQHPTWSMGPRVTIDSATMVNKGLEVIEAHWLFGIPYERIAVVIHRESVVHSMVEFVDGSVKAQLSVADMRLPIQYALSYPDRLPGGLPRLEITRLSHLSFRPVDQARFPALALAVEAGRRGGTYPAVLTASDEIAVELFLTNRIAFPDIAKLIDGALQSHRTCSDPGLEDILAADAWARRKCLALAGA